MGKINLSRTVFVVFAFVMLLLGIAVGILVEPVLKPYVLPASAQITPPPPPPPLPPKKGETKEVTEGVVGGVVGGIVGGVAVDESGSVVRAIGEIKPPKLIKQVDPKYPEIARQSRVEGIVILEAQTDIYGRVQTIKVLRSIPLLDQAAIDAVRQWVYEPMVIKGKKVGVIFTVTVRFALH